MPFRKRRFRKRNKGSSAGKLALRKINKIMKNTEKKFIDTDSASVSAGTTVLIEPLTLIGQGDTSSSREGNKVVFNTIQMKYSWKLSTSTTVGNRCRVMIIMDKQTNGAVFTAGDLLQTTGVGQVILSPLNLDGAFRFRVLYNKVHTLSPNGSEVQYRSVFKKINIPARYSGSGGSQTNILSAGIYVLYVSDTGSNSPTFSHYSRLRFIDS